MTTERLAELLGRFPRTAVAVIGDFFLDKYLIMDPALTEISLETGLEAFQVVAKRLSPGAAGTVTSNLRALEVGAVYAIGAVGDDGEGYDLRHGLEATGVDCRHVLSRAELFTPTYTKPMVRQANGSETESNRQDIKNRAAIPPQLEEAVIAELRSCLPDVAGVIVADQVLEAELGIITPRVREELGRLAADHGDKVFFADSRGSIGRFRHMLTKPNRSEAARAVGWEGAEPSTIEEAAEVGRLLVSQTVAPVFVTLGEEGLLVVTAEGCEHVPGIRVAGPIDIVGAGDSTTAGIVPSLCAGATPVEAAAVGCLVASITIQKLGTTGTASPQQVLQRLRETQPR